MVDYPPVYSLNLNLSRNFPAGYDELLLFTDATEVTDTACGVFDIDKRLFQPDSNELIVDNEDPGFRLIEPDRRRGEFTSTEEEERKYVYADEMLMDVKSKLPLRWTYCMGTRMYGDVIRSSVYKKAGNGSCKAEWRVDLPEEGKYEVISGTVRCVTRERLFNTTSYRVGTGIRTLFYEPICRKRRDGFL